MAGAKHFHIKQGSEFEVKELFKDISRIIREHFSSVVGNIDILDVGCASGELPISLKRDFKTTGMVKGLDISPDLIANAKTRFANEGVDFVVADATNFKLEYTFDVVTMTSVLSYFNEPLPVIEHALTFLKPGGIAIISGMFNPWDIDVRMQYRLGNEDKWHSAINQFSMHKISEAFAAKGWLAKFTEQLMPFDIEPKEHPVRSWTVDLNGKRHMMCGLQLVYNIQILTISRKEAV